MKTSFLLSTFRIAMVLVLAAVYWASLSPKRSLAVAPGATRLETRLAGQYTGCGSVYSLALQGSHAFLGCNTLLDIVNIADPAHPIRTGDYDPSEDSKGDGNVLDVAILNNYAYLAYTYYAEFLSVNISDLVNPSLKASCCGLQENFNASAISGNYIYTAQGSRGLRVIQTSATGTLDGGIAWDTPGHAYGVAASGSYVYLADGTGGLHVYDISAPTTPNETDDYDTPNDDARDIFVSGDYAYVADGGNGLRIFNITDPNALVPEGALDTPGTALRIAVSGNYAYIADGSAGLRVIDISDPQHPVAATSYDTPGNARDVAVSGNYVFIADENGGLVTIDVYEPPPPTATFTLTATPNKTPTRTATSTVPATPELVYLPLSLNDYVSYFEGPAEVEPNNDYLHANGPLRFEKNYFGYPNDAKDYFSFYLPEAGRLTIDLTTFTAHGAQLLLYYQAPVPGNHVKLDNDLPYHIQYDGPAGMYYLYIYAAGNYNENAYTLRATYATEGDVFTSLEPPEMARPYPGTHSFTPTLPLP